MSRSFDMSRPNICLNPQSVKGLMNLPMVVEFLSVSCANCEQNAQCVCAPCSEAQPIFCKVMDFLAIVQPISWRSSNYWLNSPPNQVAPRIGICSSSAFICASRGFSTLMSANWPLMIVNVFFVDYGVWGAPCPSMVWPQRSCGNGRKWRAAHAVGMVVNARFLVMRA